MPTEIELMPEELDALFGAVHTRDIAALRAINADLQAAVLAARKALQFARDARPCMRCYMPTLAGFMCEECR